MDDDDEALLWQQLLDKELELRVSVSGGGRTGPKDKPSAEFKETVRQWWAATEAVLSFYVRALDAGKPLSPQPTKILSNMRDVAGYLAVGQIPLTIADAASEGRRSPGPSEKRDIGLGVTYIRAAQSGFEHMGERIVVSDKSPIKTVAEAFGVHKTTVQGWKKNIPPASPGIHRVDDNVLVSLMRQAGKRYQKAGRSVVAIRARGRYN